MLPFVLTLLGAIHTCVGVLVAMKNREKAEEIIAKTNTLARNKQKELEDSLNEFSIALERASTECMKGWATLGQFVGFMEKNNYRVIIKDSENYIDSHKLIHQLKNMTDRIEKIKNTLVDNQKQRSMELSKKRREMLMASILGITSLHVLKSQEILAQSKQYEKDVMEAVKHMELQI